MKIVLDIRYRVASGASTYIHGLVPALFERAPDDCKFVYVDDPRPLPEGLPEAEVITCKSKGSLGDLAWTNFVLPRILKRKKIDVYHRLKFYGPWFCSVPVVHTSHAILGRNQPDFPLSFAQKMMHCHYRHALFRWSDYLMVVSEQMQRAFHEDHRIPLEKIGLTRPGVSETFRRALASPDLGLFDPPGLGDAPYLLCVGNIEAVKNHVTAVRALAMLKDRFPHHLVIAGRYDKPAAEELNRVIDELGMRDRVHLTGFMGLDELASCLARAELALHPSLSEGYSLAVCELMVAGLPVVGSAVPGVSEVLGGTGIVIDDPRDVDGFAAAVAGLLEDPAKAKAMGDRSRERSEQFSWQAAADITLQGYRKCLGIES